MIELPHRRGGGIRPLTHVAGLVRPVQTAVVGGKRDVGEGGLRGGLLVQDQFHPLLRGSRRSEDAEFRSSGRGELLIVGTECQGLHFLRTAQLRQPAAVVRVPDDDLIARGGRQPLIVVANGDGADVSRAVELTNELPVAGVPGGDALVGPAADDLPASGEERDVPHAAGMRRGRPQGRD